MSSLFADQRVWLSERDCDLAAFRQLVERTTDLAGYPHASSVEQGVLVYDSERLRAAERRPVRAELVRALADGPGVVVFRGAFPDPSVVDRLTAVFEALIAEQRASGASAGDHFAKPGANDRVWNALEKAALFDPEAFADYYANDILALASTAWLGPGYQVTSQVNVVNPGGAAQTAHRDYHLGFLSDDAAAAYPAHPPPPPPPPGLPARRRGGRVPAPCAPPPPGAPPAGRGPALRHAGGVRADAAPAVLAGLRARLPGLAAASVPGVLRGPSHPA